MIWDRDLYRSNTHFVIDNHIREYDISKANISILRDAGVLTEEQYQYFLHCDKLEREITIGKMQGRNPELSKILKEGFRLARKNFIESNGIQDAEVLSIRKDSVTIVGDRLIRNLQVGPHTFFRQTGDFSSYYRFAHIDIFYLADVINKIENIEIKGIGDGNIPLHKDYMIDLLSELFYSAQIRGIQDALSLLGHVYQTYITNNLDLGYYREFNSLSKYRLIPEFTTYGTLYLDSISDDQRQYIDISYNESVLRTLMRMYSSVYFGNR